MKNAQFENDIADVPNLFNKLALKETDDGELYLKGNLDLVDKAGKL